MSKKSYADKQREQRRASSRRATSLLATRHRRRTDRFLRIVHRLKSGDAATREVNFPKICKIADRVIDRTLKVLTTDHLLPATVTGVCLPVLNDFLLYRQEQFEELARGIQAAYGHNVMEKPIADRLNAWDRYIRARAPVVEPEVAVIEKAAVPPALTASIEDEAKHDKRRPRARKAAGQKKVKVVVSKPVAADDTRVMQAGPQVLAVPAIAAALQSAGFNGTEVAIAAE